MDFKVGDRVRCVDPNSNLEMGKAYTIAELADDFVGIVGLIAGAPHFLGHRFEKITEEPPLNPTREAVLAWIATNYLDLDSYGQSVLSDLADEVFGVSVRIQKTVQFDTPEN